MEIKEFEETIQKFCDLNGMRFFYYKYSEYYHIFLDYKCDVDMEEVIIAFTPQEVENCSWDQIEAKIKNTIRGEINDMQKAISELQDTLNNLQYRRNNLKSIT